MPIMTAEHTWVKHTITPVVVLEGADGEPVVFVDPDEQAESETSMTVYGCMKCSEALPGNMNTPCQGETEEIE